MITNFEEITADLSVAELVAIPHLVKLIEGADCPLKNKAMCVFLNSIPTLDFKATDSRVRKFLNYIRIKKLVKNLIATSKGYYITHDEKEIERYKKSLQERIDAITALKNSFI